MKRSNYNIFHYCRYISKTTTLKEEGEPTKCVKKEKVGDNYANTLTSHFRKEVK